jgi:Nnf1
MTEQITRYRQLLLLLDKTLSHSRKAFDIEEAIQECYGNDSKMFEADDSSSSEENVLVSAIHAMIDVVHEKAKKETLEFLDKEGIEQKLTKIETIIAKLDSSDQETKRSEEADRQTTLAALNAARLPKGVLPSDMMRYEAYHERKKHLAALQDELAKEENATKELLDRKRKLKSIIEDGDHNLQRVKQTMEESAAALNA